jgi:hypothetical protein
MTQVNKTIDNQSRSNEARGGLMAMTALTFATTVLAHPVAFLKHRKMHPDEPRYIRPPRQYEIPSFREGMKYFTSNEPYLRPTRYCNPRESEIIAMANELGACELSDWEFAEAAYWFVKENLHIEMCPLDSAGTTLRRGTGTCQHLISLFNALCRAAGIKARYKLFAMNYSDRAVRIVDPLWDRLYNSLGVVGEAEAEVYLDGAWTVAFAEASSALQAAEGLPINRLGEDAIGTSFSAVPGTVRRVEALPAGLSWGMKVLLWLSPASLERVALGIQIAHMRGQQVIFEAVAAKRTIRWHGSD